MRYYCKILRILNKDNVASEGICAKIQQPVGPHEDLLTIVMDVSPVHQVWPKPSCKAQWKEEEDKADRKKEVGRQHQGMGRPKVRQVLEGSGEWSKMEQTGCEVICGSLRLRDRWRWRWGKGAAVGCVCVCVRARLWVCVIRETD